MLFSSNNMHNKNFHFNFLGTCSYWYSPEFFHNPKFKFYSLGCEFLTSSSSSGQLLKREDRQTDLRSAGLLSKIATGAKVCQVEVGNQEVLAGIPLEVTWAKAISKAD